MIKSCFVLIFSLLPWFSLTWALVPPVPSIQASSYILVDATTGKVIAEYQADEKNPPASLTKIMTSYIVQKQIKQGVVSADDQVPVSVKAWRAQGSKMFIREGTHVALSDLMRGVVIQSGNDASIALAEFVAGDESSFAQMMNIQAAELGMTNSQFVNATGLPDSEHFSSARDLAILTVDLIRKYPKHYELYSERGFKFNNIEQPNRNRLLRYDRSVDGVKTGYTRAAGYCLIASAKRKDMRLISVVMGTESDDARVRESQKLLTYGFRNFETINVYEAGEVLKTAPMFYGQEKAISLGINGGLSLTLPRGVYENIEAEISIPKVIEAPISKGAIVGELVLKQETEVLYKTSIVSMDDHQEGDFFSRLSDYFRLLFSD